jgi:hypothetical protein
MSVFCWKNLLPYRKDRFGYYLCGLCKKPWAENSKHWCSEECLRNSLRTFIGSEKFIQRCKGEAAV